MLWVRIPLRRGVLDTTLYDKVCQWLAACRWFSPVSSTNKTDRHYITDILVKEALNITHLNYRRKMSNIRFIFLEMLIHMIYLSLTVWILDAICEMNFSPFLFHFIFKLWHDMLSVFYKNTNHIGQHVFDNYLAHIVFLYNLTHSVRNVLSRRQKTTGFAALFMKKALNNIAVTGRILFLNNTGFAILTRIVDTNMIFPKYETAVATIKLIVSCRPFSYLLRLWVFTGVGTFSPKNELADGTSFSWLEETCCVSFDVSSDDISIL